MAMGPNFMGRSYRAWLRRDRKSTRLNSSHGYISYAVFCLKKKRTQFSRLALPPMHRHTPFPPPRLLNEPPPLTHTLCARTASLILHLITDLHSYRSSLILF